MTTVNIDDLLAARQRLDQEKAAAKGRVAAVAPAEGVTEDLTLLRLIGLWLVITGLIVLKILANVLIALAEVVEWLRRENARKRTARRRR
jgi:hypothetical protein